MKRLVIAIILFLSACLMCIAGYFILNNTCEQLDEMLETSIECAEKEDGDMLIANAEQLSATWEKYRTVFSVLTQHSHLDSFEQKIRILSYYAQTGDFAQYTQTCREAQNGLLHLIESERVTIGNIF